MMHEETHPTLPLWVGYRMLPKLAHMGFRQDLLPTLPGAERQKQACLRHASRMSAPECDIYVRWVWECQPIFEVAAWPTRLSSLRMWSISHLPR